MAEKKKNTKKSSNTMNREVQPKKTEKKEEIKKVDKKDSTQKEVKIIQATHDYTSLLKRVVNCMYVIIVLLVVIGIINVISPKASNWTTDSGNNEAGEEENLGEYDVSKFKAVTTDNLKKTVSGDTTKILYIGRSTCGYCVQFLPVLEKAQKAYGYETLYLDITTVTTAEQQQKVMDFDNKEKFLEQNFGSTPMVLAFKDGKMIDTWVGYAEYDSFAKWVEGVGFKTK